MWMPTLSDATMEILKYPTSTLLSLFDLNFAHATGIFFKKRQDFLRASDLSMKWNGYAFT
jgi:hypothetical protein